MVNLRKWRFGNQSAVCACKTTKFLTMTVVIRAHIVEINGGGLDTPGGKENLQYCKLSRKIVLDREFKCGYSLLLG